MQSVIVDDEPLARERLKSLIEKDGRLSVIGEAADGLKALEQIRTLQPDIVFLDIQMPELTGIEVATRLQDSDSELPIIVFVTAYDEFALNAFDLHAIDYLLKPFDRLRFRSALDKAIAAHLSRDAAGIQSKLAKLISAYHPTAAQYTDRLSIKADGRIIILPVSDIEYINSASNYVEVHTEGKMHLMRETLSQLEAELDPKRFLRISRSTIVAVDRIREIHPLFHGEHTLILASGTRIASTRSYRDALKPLLGK